GALNEHTADLFGNLIFPDTNPHDWLVGENTNNGAIRDMANPGMFGHPGHYGNMTALCGDPAACVHEWAGVPNRAATLIVDGGVPGSSHPGIGRPTAAVLYLAMLTGGNAASTDLFLDERLNLIATCNALVANGTVIAGRQMAQADCDHIAKAFDTVGVVAPI